MTLQKAHQGVMLLLSERLPPLCSKLRDYISATANLVLNVVVKMYLCINS